MACFVLDRCARWAISRAEGAQKMLETGVFLGVRDTVAIGAGITAGVFTLSGPAWVVGGVEQVALQTPALRLRHLGLRVLELRDPRPQRRLQLLVLDGQRRHPGDALDQLRLVELRRVSEDGPDRPAIALGPAAARPVR